MQIKIMAPHSQNDVQAILHSITVSIGHLKLLNSIDNIGGYLVTKAL